MMEMKKLARFLKKLKNNMNITDREKIRQQHKEEREKYTNLILASKENKRIVVGGPGTGKTFLFKEICKNTNGKKLVLTFINELVNDLEQNLGEFAEVRTLHSFSVKLLKKDFYSKLTEIIEEDYRLYYGKEAGFKKIFTQLQRNQEKLDFYFRRCDYYKCLGPLCSIYYLIKNWEKEPDKIPVYDQILVDEFQDFNNLEIKLIDILSRKSAILLVGDDDQALYSFKCAGPEEIRKRCGGSEYKRFELPYCSRCPEVLVNATNRIIQKAQKQGFLKGRIEKKFLYFCSEEKDEISNANPKIVFKSPVFLRQVAAYIDNSLRNISQNDNNFTVLIICPLASQIPVIADALNKRGFINIEIPPKRIEFSKQDGYFKLLKEESSNLGWRILAHFTFRKKTLKNLIKKSIEKNEQFKNIFPKEKRKYVIDILKVLKKIQGRKTISSSESQKIFKEFKIDSIKIALEKIREQLISNVFKEKYKNISIKIVTMLGAKGLTRDYVFLVNFDDRFVLEKGKKITDESICKFLVALTRAKKRLTIFSSQKSLPIFLQWLGKEFLQS